MLINSTRHLKFHKKFKEDRAKEIFKNIQQGLVFSEVSNNSTSNKMARVQLRCRSSEVFPHPLLYCGGMLQSEDKKCNLASLGKEKVVLAQPVGNEWNNLCKRITQRQTSQRPHAVVKVPERASKSQWREQGRREKNKTFFYSFYSSCFILFGLGLGFVKGRGRDVDFLNLIFKEGNFYTRILHKLEEGCLRDCTTDVCNAKVKASPPQRQTKYCPPILHLPHPTINMANACREGLTLPTNYIMLIRLLL